MQALEPSEGKKRGDVVFDEGETPIFRRKQFYNYKLTVEFSCCSASRLEFLTGFRKRKQERRTFGLAMQKVKEKKQHKEEVKERRKSVQNATATIEQDSRSNPFINGYDDDEDDNGSFPVILRAVAINEELIFQDDQTKNMFGDTVTVVVDTDILANQLESHQFPAGSDAVVPAGRQRQNPKGALTANKGRPDRNNKSSTNKKFTKGAPQGGKNTFNRKTTDSSISGKKKFVTKIVPAGGKSRK
jgi:hypothetical protein